MSIVVIIVLLSAGHTRLCEYLDLNGNDVRPVLLLRITFLNAFFYGSREKPFFQSRSVILAPSSSSLGFSLFSRPGILSQKIFLLLCSGSDDDGESTLLKRRTCCCFSLKVMALSSRML
ncbi:hypothetical protein MPTK1_7g08600 [Marchantia polymorpha subsp. ruderalis]|uniref:Secreted protein n=2 Tax=Marchantia polymorpha TaxID=3197 RepID=A0AAF6BXG9_MARPO|nr:hypothetical protein MARPO_0068s0014 [Marchantia polymorpha]BBN16703.1 hypothetical protein Mp_7g08600 [Marchantia polymorpha subsp. ruderalis]|eukprot:PTQ35786.1 hypothetical protein MARPO_0068s0014 [Marchantia polymorpha]